MHPSPFDVVPLATHLHFRRTVHHMTPWNMCTVISPGRYNTNRPRMEPVRGMELLWQPSVVEVYLLLLNDASNPETLEAAAGAIQNLAACDWQVRQSPTRFKGIFTQPDTETDQKWLLQNCMELFIPHYEEDWMPVCILIPQLHWSESDIAWNALFILERQNWVATPYSLEAKWRHFCFHWEIAPK